MSKYLWVPTELHGYLPTHSTLTHVVAPPSYLDKPWFVMASFAKKPKCVLCWHFGARKAIRERPVRNFRILILQIYLFYSCPRIVFADFQCGPRILQGIWSSHLRTPKLLSVQICLHSINSAGSGSQNQLFDALQLGKWQTGHTRAKWGQHTMHSWSASIAQAFVCKLWENRG